MINHYEPFHPWLSSRFTTQNDVHGPAEHQLLFWAFALSRQDAQIMDCHCRANIFLDSLNLRNMNIMLIPNESTSGIPILEWSASRVGWGLPNWQSSYFHDHWCSWFPALELDRLLAWTRAEYAAYNCGISPRNMTLGFRINQWEIHRSITPPYIRW